jgi:DNA mismatch repair protein MutS
MMRQYWDIKSQYSECLLLFRLGDFYELFDEDAHVGARELDITLTGRPEPTYPNGRVPMAGVPVKSVDLYLAKLIGKGYSVAICEQVGVVGQAKGPVERQVTRVLTPGTVLESNLLPVRENNYLAAIYRAGEAGSAEARAQLWGLAFADASCGEFCLTQLTEAELILEIARIAPRELLVAKRTVRGGGPIPQEVLDLPDGLSGQQKITGRPSMFFQLEPCRRRVLETFNVTTLEGFGCHGMPLAIGCAGAIIEYLQRTQTLEMPKFTGICTYSANEYLMLDPTSRKNLEITETVRDRALEGSLLWCLDKTKTGMGSRLLRNWLVKPLLDIESILQRQDAIEELLGSAAARRELNHALSTLSDLERLGVRLSSATINPRDLLAVGQSLSALPKVAEQLAECVSPLLTKLCNQPASLPELGQRIMEAIKEDCHRELTEGNIFKDGHSAELDEVRALLGGGKHWMDDFQRREQARTGVKSLKVSVNSTFGYYIEITHANKGAVPEDYIRKQTLTNAERYITPELKEYEAKILNAEKNQGQLEYKLFLELRTGLSQYGQDLKEVARQLATLDALLSLADAAAEYNYVRPVVDDSLILDIKEGRHPVLERILPMGRYVANDTFLSGRSDDQQMIILTGPNMAGKSSLLRQAAHITILAQMGSFVPARSARIGVVDRIFTRIGAVDDLTQGQSTFLVEMSETTQCCLSSTERSLILLDEVGRGTSTYDGVAIAWAVAEYLATTVGARTIFATHYHELNGLANFHGQIKNYQVCVEAGDGHIEFMHRLIEGGASRSFGIHVAGMAGLPKQIIERAHALMSQMEKRSAAKAILEGPKRNIALDDVMQLRVFTE